MHKQILHQVLSLIDLTSLNDNDSEHTIYELCMKTKTAIGSVPAICIYSWLVPFAKDVLAEYNPPVKIATVTNFPHGSPDFKRAMFETKLALERGADEVDIVFPYHALIAGDSACGEKIVSHAKELCKDKTLKVIIESGALADAKLIREASIISIANGANFIKTSTGKVTTSATLDAAKIMLNVIKESGGNCGFKASGGIKTLVEALKYLSMAEQIMGKEWLTTNHFRFGASALLDDVISALGGNHYL